MKHNLARMIVNLSEGDLKLYENYSGRGMEEQETTAFYGEESSFLAVLTGISQEDLEAYGIERDELKPAVSRFCKDNLGHDTIWY
jgi:hypothetical protein